MARTTTLQAGLVLAVLAVLAALAALAALRGRAAPSRQATVRGYPFKNSDGRYTWAGFTGKDRQLIFLCPAQGRVLTVLTTGPSAGRWACYDSTDWRTTVGALSSCYGMYSLGQVPNDYPDAQVAFDRGLFALVRAAPVKPDGTRVAP